MNYLCLVQTSDIIVYSDPPQLADMTSRKDGLESEMEELETMVTELTEQVRPTLYQNRWFVLKTFDLIQPRSVSQ